MVRIGIPAVLDIIVGSSSSFPIILYIALSGGLLSGGLCLGSGLFLGGFLFSLLEGLLGLLSSSLGGFGQSLFLVDLND